MTAMHKAENELSASDLPFDVTELGDFQMAWEECPGVYYVAVERPDSPLSAEFYAVTADAAMISPAARAYGQPCPGRPDVLLFDLQADHGGWYVLDYEIGKYEAARNIPLPNGDTLAEIAAFGREQYPEYFGDHPVPHLTPWGPTLRHRSLARGIVWIETEAEGWVLAVSRPIGEELSDGALALAETDAGQQKAQAPCLFFPWQRACVPIFELSRVRPEWERDRVIDRAALMNAIWEHHPEYAMAYNAQEQAGLNDALGLVMNALGADVELKGSEKNMIAVTPKAGTDFYSFG